MRNFVKLKPINTRTIRRISKYKIWFDRSRQYISYVQFMLLIYIAIEQLNPSPFKTWVFKWWYISFPAVFTVFLTGCMILGFIESILKIREYEYENYSEQNLAWQKMMKKLDNIEGILKNK